MDRGTALVDNKVMGAGSDRFAVAQPHRRQDQSESSTMAKASISMTIES